MWKIAAEARGKGDVMGRVEAERPDWSLIEQPDVKRQRFAWYILFIPLPLMDWSISILSVILLNLLRSEGPSHLAFSCYLSDLFDYHSPASVTLILPTLTVLLFHSTTSIFPPQRFVLNHFIHISFQMSSTRNLL